MRGQQNMKISTTNLIYAGVLQNLELFFLFIESKHF